MRPMMLLRSFQFLTILMVTTNSSGQTISGIFERPLPASTVVLYRTTGSDHPALDSTMIESDGRFEFDRVFTEPGFYQLGVNDSDRVDIILDPLEPSVELAFHGTPLQRNMNIINSGENQRMWAYKLMSRSAQERATAIQMERSKASPTDAELLLRLSREEVELRDRLRKSLDSLALLAPNGQFAFGVGIDHRLDAAIPLGADSILRAIDLSDPRILRSAAFAKATVAYLQRTPYDHGSAMLEACDSLLNNANRDPSTWTYMRSFLIDLFTTYGPDDVAQYLVDQYVVGDGSRYPPDRELLNVAAAQLRIVIGAPAPDMELVRPGLEDTTLLSKVWPKHAYTGLFFYSSTCDHCHDQMPGLRQIVSEWPTKNFQLIGIALDATEEEFLQTLEEESINWPSYTRLMGWGDQGAKDFNVKATPSLFVLNREGKIVAKPLDHEELREFLLSQKK